MPAGEQVTLKPAFALVLTEHLNDAPLRRKKFVVGEGRGFPLTLGGFKHSSETVGDGFVRAKDSEVSLLSVQLDHVAQERPKNVRIADALNSRRGHVDGIVAKIGHPEITQQTAAVGMG